MKRIKDSLFQKHDQKINNVSCFYCGLQLDDREEIIIKDRKYYHKKCFNTLFTLTLKRTINVKKQKTESLSKPWYFAHI
jgi:hypothetical protein